MGMILIAIMMSGNLPFNIVWVGTTLDDIFHILIIRMRIVRMGVILGGNFLGGRYPGVEFS